MMDHLLNDQPLAGTANFLPPYGDISWANTASAATEPENLKHPLKKDTFALEGEDSETLSSKPRVFVFLSDEHAKAFKCDILPLPLYLTNELFLPNAWVESSTVLNIPHELEQRFEFLFALAKNEVFEDGMESDFSRNLVALINRYQKVALDILTEIIMGGSANPEVASEALRWVGHIENPLTHRSRLELLERSLFSSSLRIRDGAILGLGSLDDPRAMSYIEQAIERETIPELRDDLIDLLEQLQETLLES